MIKWILLSILLVGCAGSPSLEKGCTLEKYCAATEGSTTKAILRAGFEAYTKGELIDACENHYAYWGIDYRAPLEERCE